MSDECNLRCAHCLYKPNLQFHLRDKEIELQTALAIISDFREMGASKLTLMGGEPTLYGISNDWEPLFQVIAEAKAFGYEYVRIDTNGQFNSRLLEKDNFRKLDEITFSLDGPNPKLNDKIRGSGTFEKCTQNIKKAVELDYNTSVTCCIHKDLLQKQQDGSFYLDDMIRFVESLGAKTINFHDLFKTGLPRDAWTGDFAPPLQDWQAAYAQIHTNIEAGKYSIPVRIPKCFIDQEEFKANKEYYGYCPAKLGERVLVHPNGIIRVCSLLIGTPYGVAKYHQNLISWNDSPTNELSDHKLDQHTPCTNQCKSKGHPGLVPLCVSFKPKQDEFVWTDKLHWERKRVK